MLKLISTAMAVCITAAAFCQTSHTRYFTSRSLEKQTSREEAKFSETVLQNPDGTTTIMVKNIRKDEVVSTETYKGKEPAGVWKYKGAKPIDYAFDLVYSEKSCDVTGRRVHDYFEDNDARGYKAPKFATSAKNLIDLIAKNLRYPSVAVENNIEGKVTMSFTITAEGTIENIVINKSAHPVLDKEAARVIRGASFSSPAMENGRPVPLCITIPVSFALR